MNWFIQCAKISPVLASVVFLTACGRNDVKVYEVPKERPPATTQGSLPAGHPDVSAPSMPGMMGSSTMPKLTWTKPEGWAEAPAGQMRVASFTVKREGDKVADVSVIPLPGMAGGTESNVNRWRGQVGLGPLSADELAKTAEDVEVGGQSAKLFDVAGSASGSGDPTRILGVIQIRDGMAWFFKMTGDNQLVAKEKAVFVAFLKSVKFETDEAAANLPAGHPPVDTPALPAGHPDVSATPAAAATSAPATEGKPKWSAPPSWKEIPGGQFLVAKFVLTGEGNSQAAVNVSSSAGDGGGLAANVNRWRKQLGLSDLSSDELAKAAKTIETTGGKATLIEMAGTDARTGQPAALTGEIVPRDGQTWFYKLMGDAKVVANQQEAFTKFVKEVNY